MQEQAFQRLPTLATCPNNEWDSLEPTDHLRITNVFSHLSAEDFARHCGLWPGALKFLHSYYFWAGFLARRGEGGFRKLQDRTESKVREALLRGRSVSLQAAAGPDGRPPGLHEIGRAGLKQWKDVLAPPKQTIAQIEAIAQKVWPSPANLMASKVPTGPAYHCKESRGRRAVPLSLSLSFSPSLSLSANRLIEIFVVGVSPHHGRGHHALLGREATPPVPSHLLLHASSILQQTRCANLRTLRSPASRVPRR